MTRFWAALDVASLPEAEARMERLAPHREFKVGLELYHRIGPEGISKWTKQGYAIFLDAKLHDIPATVAGAVANIEDLGVELVTLHIGGGTAMLEAAREASRTMGLVGVTILTSLDQTALYHLGFHKRVADVVLDYAKIAKRSHIAGVVVSAKELAAVHQLWPTARLVVPGIRWPGDASHDQERIGDPSETVANGATDLVLGRGLWQSPDPMGRLKQLTSSLDKGPLETRKDG